ncbi:hypothetical protein AgCh_005151 [Apium graveolens]
MVECGGPGKSNKGSGHYGGKDRIGNSVGQVAVKNRFDVLDLDTVEVSNNLVVEGLDVVPESVMVKSQQVVEKSAVEILNDRVKEHILSGSNLPPEVISRMEQNIEELEEHQNRIHKVKSVSGFSNSDKDILSEPDDTDNFMLQGSPQGVGMVKKLDRVLANLDFFQKFGGAKVSFLPRGVSDHSSAIVKLCQARQQGKRSFKFNNFLAYRNNFLNLVEAEWSKRDGGFKMFQIVQKLHRLKRVFKTESWKGGNLAVQGELLKNRLIDIQKNLDLTPFDEDLKKKEANISREYRTCRLEEERLLKQRAKVHWLKVGDQNSKFFHKSLQSRRLKKKVIEIVNQEGVSLQGAEMNDHFVDFYKLLLGSKDYCDKCVGLEPYARKLEPGAASAMVREVTSVEIKEVFLLI